MFLGIAAWLVVGVVVGFVATKIVNLRGDDPRLSIGVAALGAIAGGAVYSMVSGETVGALNVWGLVSAAAGAVVGALVWHLVRSRFISHDGYTVRRSY
jgi:uncharacterized membrane protein YeaQ/YmgE (transglycosylase-associated protein family)